MTIHEQMSLAGRVALITGGAGHVGRMAADILAELGSHIVILDNDRKAAETVAQAIQEKYAVQSIPIVVDLEEDNFVLNVMPVIQKNSDV